MAWEARRKEENMNGLSVWIAGAGGQLGCAVCEILQKDAGLRVLTSDLDVDVASLEAVASGQLYGTVLNDGRGQAQAMLDLAQALWAGEDPAQAVTLEDGHYVWLPYRLVTQDNLERLREQYHLLTREPLPSG